MSVGSLVGELTTDVNSTVEHLRELGEIPTVIITTCIYKTAHKGSRTGCKENERYLALFSGPTQFSLLLQAMMKSRSNKKLGRVWERS